MIELSIQEKSKNSVIDKMITMGHEQVVHCFDKETGLKFEPKNHEKLAQAIEHYIQNPSDIKKHGDAGRKRFEAEYTIDVYSKNFIAAIENSIVR